jgi:RNA polymerase sigma-70 factor (ECF subfamily)
VLAPQHHHARMGTEDRGSSLLEAGILEGLREGDPASFKRLHDLHAPRLLRLLSRLTHDEALARDALQATFLIVFRKIGGFDERSSLATWMTRIAIREARRLVQRASRESPAPLTESDAGPPVDSPEDSLGRRQLARRLAGLIEAMPWEKRTALVLFEVEGLSVQEIADLSEEPRGTILARLHRVRLELRGAMESWMRAGRDE